MLAINLWPQHLISSEMVMVMILKPTFTSMLQVHGDFKMLANG